MQEYAMVFNIQKYCIHDGPGIRTTVFLKGCPLRCRWCHNPEGLLQEPQLLIDQEKCTACGRCVDRCPVGAIHLEAGTITTDRERCTVCGTCVAACGFEARAISGRKMSIEDLWLEIKKDRIFYDQSGGGVTFSGGEPLCQPSVVEALARRCREQYLSVAVDTGGHVPFSCFEKVLPYTDLFLYDLKHLDPEAHRQYTGVDNRLILENLQLLSARGARIWLRIPLIEGINADDGHMHQVIDFIKGLHVVQTHLLPYHRTGNSKYERLGWSTTATPALTAPAPERLEQIRQLFIDAELPVLTGG